MSLEGKTVGILVAANVEDLELHYPRLRFKYVYCLELSCNHLHIPLSSNNFSREEGAKVLCIGPTSNYKGTGKHGLPANADTAIDDITAADLDCLIVPGKLNHDFASS